MVIRRRAARALLLADRSILLIRGHDPARPDAGSWWLTPGGGVEDGESVEAALKREVLEETGLALDGAQLGPVVATRTAAFEFQGRRYHQEESFFAVEVTRFTPTTEGWDDLEHTVLLDHRWWDVDDLAATDETIFPRALADVTQAVLDHELVAPVRLTGP